MERAQPMTGLDALIREIYIRERECYENARRQIPMTYHPGPTWDGGIDKASRRRQPYWPKISAIVRKHRLDADAYVRRAFVGRPATAPAPLPSDLVKPAALQSYHQAQSVITTEIRLALPIQQRACQLEFNKLYRMTDWVESETWRSVLYNERLPMTALFRYCTAVKLKLNEVASEYLLGAAYQYAINCDVYDQVWGDFIPPKFRDRAERIYLDLINVEELEYPT